VLTSLDFTANDVCSYVITNEIFFQYEVEMTLNVKKLSNAALYLMGGSSVNDLSSMDKHLPGTSTKLKTD